VVSEPAQERSNLIIPLMIIAGILPVVGGTWWYLDHKAAQVPPAAPLTAEAKAYVPSLKLSHVEMRGAKNLTGASTVEITGQITNSGTRPIGRIELTCIFYDPNGMLVARERVAIIRSLLAQGETKEFRMPFEGLPDTWNHAMPQLVIANITFAG
jgi:hypothetical protein